MRIKLGVFFGGKSVEHEISVITMIQALEGIDEEKYEIIARALIEEEFGGKRNWGDVTEKYSLRDAYRTIHCEECLSEEWINTNLYTEEDEAMAIVEFIEGARSGIPAVRWRKQKVRITKQMKKRNEREAWDSEKNEWRENKGDSDEDIINKATVYLEFCEYIKGKEIYSEYKDAIDSLLGKVLYTL